MLAIDHHSSERKHCFDMNKSINLGGAPFYLLVEVMLGRFWQVFPELLSGEGEDQCPQISVIISTNKMLS